MPRSHPTSPAELVRFVEPCSRIRPKEHTPMDRTLPSVRSARFAQRARRMGLATAVVASLALGTVVASPAGAAPVVPFAPVATIAVPAGVSDVSVSADGADLLAFSAEDSSLVSIDLDACDTTAFGLDAQDCDIDWSAPLADDAQAWFVDSSGAGQVFVIAQRGSDGVLTRFDRGSGAVIGTPIVLPGHTVHALTYVPAVNTAYVLAEDGVVLVDVVAGIVTGTIEPNRFGGAGFFWTASRRSGSVVLQNLTVDYP